MIRLVKFYRFRRPKGLGLTSLLRTTHITRDAEAEPELKLKRQQSVYIVPKEPPYFRYIIKAEHVYDTTVRYIVFNFFRVRSKVSARE